MSRVRILTDCSCFARGKQEANRRQLFRGGNGDERGCDAVIETGKSDGLDNAAMLKRNAGPAELAALKKMGGVGGVGGGRGVFPIAEFDAVFENDLFLLAVGETKCGFGDGRIFLIGGEGDVRAGFDAAQEIQFRGGDADVRNLDLLRE